MWRNVVQQAGDGLLATVEYVLKSTGILAFFSVIGTSGTFLDKLSACLNPFVLFIDSSNAIYRQITNMAEIIVDYNSLEMPVFTELYAEGTLDGVMRGLDAGARYIVTVDQNFSLAPASTFVAAMIGFGVFFGVGSALRIIRQRDRDLLRIRMEKKLWNMIGPGSAGKDSIKKAQSNRHLTDELDERKPDKMQDSEEIPTKNEAEKPVAPTSHGKLKLVKLPEISEAKFQEQAESEDEDKTASEEKQDEQGPADNVVDDKESSDWKTQIAFTSDLDEKPPSDADQTPAKDLSANLTSNENGQHLNGNGHHKSNGNDTLNEELEKSLIRQLKQQEEEKNSQEKKSPTPQNYTLNEFLERARSS